MDTPQSTAPSTFAPLPEFLRVSANKAGRIASIVGICRAALDAGESDIEIQAVGALDTAIDLLSELEDRLKLVGLRALESPDTLTADLARDLMAGAS